ncbi:MAG: hypothetical protein AB2A00_21025 [Myxococcota bacterium]
MTTPYDPLASHRETPARAPSLLAVDLGMRSGLAVYGDDGKLLSYRSQNFGTPARLRRAVPQVLSALPTVRWLFMEGDRNLAAIWEKTAEKRGITCRTVGAETWRAMLLLSREQRSGPLAKQSADKVARQVIAWSDAPRPTSLNDDVAEAILLGLWGARELGWLPGDAPWRSVR